jgi:hypothetical protein
MSTITNSLLGLFVGFRDIAEADEVRAREKYALTREMGKNIALEVMELQKMMQNIGL